LEGRVSADGFRFWVLSFVGFSSNDHRKSDLRWSSPGFTLRSGLSLSRSLSLSQSASLSSRVSRCLSEKREERKTEILRKGNGTRKGKERGAEEERGEAGKKKKLLKNKWREEIWSQIWRWILT